MSQLRFATARALFDAFPEVSEKIGVAPTDQSPIDFVKGLMSADKLTDAVTFCAYLLPRREAVWWACRCVRALAGDAAVDRTPGLLAAEAWVYEPDDGHRQAALDVANKGNTRDPTTWLALAAGWSGGTLGYGAPVAPYMTARAARVAVLTGMPPARKEVRQTRLRECVLEAVKIAEDGL
jgi:hypothetical protein